MAHGIEGIKRDVTIKSVWRDRQLIRAGPRGQDAPAIKDLKRIGIDDDAAALGRDRQRQRRFSRSGRPGDEHRFVDRDVLWVDHEQAFVWRSRAWVAFSGALGIEHAKFGTEDKLPAAEDFLKTLGFGWHQAAAMGDDWPDLPMLQRAALSCAPINAHAQALALAHFVTSRQGGFGAARELCDLLVLASGQYAPLLARVGSSSSA